MFLSDSLKDIISIKIKSRADDYADQFSRIFIVKMLMISALVTSLDYFKDTMTCIRSGNAKAEEKYVNSLCWIKGFYVYKDLFGAIEDFHAYGMPRDSSIDGVRENGESICAQKTKDGIRNIGCTPLTQIYFTQYQYMPFYIASLAILYYLPYIMFRIINSDIIALKKDVAPPGEENSSSEKDALHIANTYFSPVSWMGYYTKFSMIRLTYPVRYSRNGGVGILRLRVLAHLSLKVIYFLVNCSGFWFTDRILNHRYMDYGMRWITWSRLNNTMAYRFSHQSNRNLTPKPGDYLLPSLGFCDVQEGYHDRIGAINNKYKTICEISPHIMYQYVLLVLWFVFVIGISASLSGVLCEFVCCVMMIIRAATKRNAKNMGLYQGCTHLTFRELRYLDVIQRKNDLMYKEVLHLARTEKNI